MMAKLIRQFTGEWEMTALGEFVKSRTVRGMVKPRTGPLTTPRSGPGRPKRCRAPRTGGERGGAGPDSARRAPPPQSLVNLE